MTSIHIDLQKVSKATHHRPHKRELTKWFLCVQQHLEQQESTPERFVSRDQYELTLRIVDEDESTKINNRFRSINKPTNVLSFPFESPVKETDSYLGDLIMCGAVIEREAQDYNLDIKSYWAKLFIHGCLHLFGYSHDHDQDYAIMEAITHDCLDALKQATPDRTG